MTAVDEEYFKLLDQYGPVSPQADEAELLMQLRAEEVPDPQILILLTAIREEGTMWIQLDALADSGF